MNHRGTEGFWRLYPGHGAGSVTTPPMNLRTMPLAFVLTGFTVWSSLVGAQAVPPTRAENDPALTSFDREFRKALSDRDPVALALLVQFPLRLNHGESGVTLLANPAALQSRFDEAFPVAVRAAVLESRRENLFLRGSTVGYPNGVVWLDYFGEGDSARYRVVGVNLPSLATPCKGGCMRRVVFVCDAAKHRVILDVGDDRKVRYRAWNKPRAVTELPDLELSPAEVTAEGTTPCVAATWTFRRGDSEYQLSEIGCGGSFDVAGEVGSLTVSVGGKVQAQWPCY